jgi:hypothetical protein
VRAFPHPQKEGKLTPDEASSLVHGVSRYAPCARPLLELAVCLYQIRPRLIRSLKRVLAHLWEDSEV